jgi:hypothetical protein
MRTPEGLLTPATWAITSWSPLPTLGTVTLIWYNPASVTPADDTAAVTPPMMTVTEFASSDTDWDMFPGAMAGLVGPNPVPYRLTMAPDAVAVAPGPAPPPAVELMARVPLAV